TAVIRHGEDDHEQQKQRDSEDVEPARRVDDPGLHSGEQCLRGLWRCYSEQYEQQAEATCTDKDRWIHFDPALLHYCRLFRGWCVVVHGRSLASLLMLLSSPGRY